ncbi:MAG: MaoC family dehydratase [Dehalococcoidia bacterium]|nr:MAG: MaoC family dehydratase [Dehalococcoidia bacterium]
MDQKPKLSDIHQGDSLPSVVKQITQKDINLYAEASGDFNPIHVDESFAAQTPLGGTIAHGMLILAYISEMMTEAFGQSWLSGGKLSVRFKAPARPGDTITASGKIDSIEHKEGIPYVNCSIESCNQKGETVITGGAVVKL